jgi:hypothetical protein
MIATNRIAIASFLTASASVALLTGCGMTPLSSSAGSPITGSATIASGRVMGGQQPVAGVDIQLYSAGTSGYASAATALFPAGSIKTTASGNFTIPAYTCADSNPAIFLVAKGGTPIGGSPNANLAMMVGLGPCKSVNQNAFINVNELTTVATVWALSGFMTGPTNLGTPASNSTGLNLAFAAINKIANTASGTTSGPALPTGATLPVAEINALGNILQNCVNSAGGSASDTTDGVTNGTPCGKLFFLTKVGGIAPTETITAALNIAHNPSVNVASLDQLQATSPAFSPSLSVNTPPNDWTIAINYTGGGLSSPKALAIDASGNVWVTAPSINRVVKLDNTGAGTVVSGFVGSGPSGIAIDQSGDAWVANNTGNTLAKIDPTGATSSTFSNNGLSSPVGVAIDGAGNVWVTNSGTNTISAFTNSGAPASSSPFSGGGLNSPTSIAINPK